jgi:hypothetical protein
VMAYPVNLEAFVRGSTNPDFDPEASLVDSASGRHPQCSQEMAASYRAIERASKLVLDYADVMHPVMSPKKAARKRIELAQAADTFNQAIAAADQIALNFRTPLADAEKELWRYSRDIAAGLSDYLAARNDSGGERVARGEAAIAKLDGAIDHIRKIDPNIKGTWGAYDLEWMRELWLSALRRGLDREAKPAEEMF